jgi:aryl-alcohol dehydrogenase-like predicted oxidoreductase
MVERLALGTVQFGLEYGVANRSGLVSAEDAATILDRALKMGINTLDTAIAYGVSEETLGRVGVQGWNVVTKLPPVPESSDDIDGWVEDAVTGSLRRLQRSKLYGLLLHDPRQLAGTMGDRLFEALTRLREQGLVEKIGISIHHPSDLDAICGRYSLDLVQGPFNVLDRRLATSGWLTRLHDAGTEVYVRSAFLQGLLLMTPGTRPRSFSRWQPLWDQWDKWLSYSNLTALQASLGFALSEPRVDRVVVGVDNLAQLEEIFAAVGRAIPAPPMELMTDDLDLIDPSRWKKL